MDRTDSRWNDVRTIASSGNVYVDLGFSPAEAAVLALRTELMVRLKQLIKERRWTQLKASQILGITSSRVSDLKRSKYDSFTVDTLLTLAVRAGLHPQIKWAA